jgi:25S rRNA (uracil2634-N3)-methyltransferase
MASQIRDRKRRERNHRVSLETSNNFPQRDLNLLFCPRETVACAIRKLCIPCAYKLGNFDITLDRDFTSHVPNQRPETCPRIAARPSSSDAVGIMGYYPGMNILLCGDGDFSYSLAVARLLNTHDPIQESPTSPTTIVATSYESNDALFNVYPDISDTIQELKGLNCKVFFEVDATRLDVSLPLKERKKFDRIVWNFPCKAVPHGQDGQNDDMEENKELIRRFVGCARDFMAPGAELHICHKTKPPFNQWKLEDIVTSADGIPAYKFNGKVVLDRALMPPYVPRKALDKKSFPCHDACVFIFSLDLDQKGSFVPTIHPESGFLQPVLDTLLLEVRKSHLFKAKINEFESRKYGRKRVR